MFGRAAQLLARYFTEIHGDPHLMGRISATRRLVDLHEDRTASFSADLTAGAWNMAVSDYDESYCEWVRILLRILQNGT